MRFVLSLCLFLSCFLVGCGTVPLSQNHSYVQFPEPPPTSTAKCPNLQLLPIDSTMQNLAAVVTNNYEAYHLCSTRNNAWIEWYEKQREIFNNKKLFQ
jgi:hypothetical protein